MSLNFWFWLILLWSVITTLGLALCLYQLDQEIKKSDVLLIASEALCKLLEFRDLHVTNQAIPKEEPVKTLHLKIWHMRGRMTPERVREMEESLNQSAQVIAEAREKIRWRRKVCTAQPGPVTTMLIREDTRIAANALRVFTQMGVLAVSLGLPVKPWHEYL